MKLPRSRWLPQPLLSLVMVVTWVLATNTLDFSSVFFGALLGIVIPIFTQRFWPDYPRLTRWSKVLSFTLLVLYDIVVANLRVAWLIVGPRDKLRPRFITVPTELNHPLAVTLLTSIISLTPGTVSSQVSEDQCFILVHSLDCPDEVQMVSDIKRRYEAPLKEIFGC